MVPAVLLLLFHLSNTLTLKKGNLPRNSQQALHSAYFKNERFHQNCSEDWPVNMRNRENAIKHPNLIAHTHDPNKNFGSFEKGLALLLRFHCQDLFGFIYIQMSFCTTCDSKKHQLLGKTVGLAASIGAQGRGLRLKSRTQPVCRISYIQTSCCKEKQTQCSRMRSYK